MEYLIEKTMYRSRWLLAPIYLGLSLALVALGIKFFQETFHLLVHIIELKEAAKMLGLTPEDLSDMRDRGEIHGYRDGGSWKFKPEEVDRVAAEIGAAAAESSDVAEADSSSGDLDDFISLADLSDDYLRILTKASPRVHGDLPKPEAETPAADPAKAAE